MFCPECGSILRPKEKAGKRVLYCACGFSKGLDAEATMELKEQGSAAKKIEVLEQVEILPKIKATCEQCGHKIAYYWTRQTRGADEPETRFFKCAKCSYTWREYA